jgi:hypothetical protein
LAAPDCRSGHSGRPFLSSLPLRSPVVHPSEAVIQPGRGTRWRIADVPENWNRYRVWLVNSCNIGAGNAASACSPGRHDHANRLRLRPREDTSWWCLRGQNYDPPRPQVRPMVWRRLRSVAGLLNSVQSFPPRPVGPLGSFRAAFLRLTLRKRLQSKNHTCSESVLGSCSEHLKTWPLRVTRGGLSSFSQHLIFWPSRT